MDAAKDSEVTHTTTINMYLWLREVCSITLINGPPILLGGPGKVVQIDESLF